LHSSKSSFTIWKLEREKREREERRGEEEEGDELNRREEGTNLYVSIPVIGSTQAQDVSL